MGIMRILDHFEVYPLQAVNMNEPDISNLSLENLTGPPNTILCSRGFWVSYLYSCMRENVAKIRHDSCIRKRAVFWKFIQM